HALRNRQGGAVVERERELRRRGGSRCEPVVEQASESGNRLALGCRAQERLVRVALLVEGEHVGERGPEIEQTDRIVVVPARRQALQAVARRDPLEERGAEAAVGAGAIGDPRQAGTVLDRHRRRGDAGLAAAARLGHPLPPLTTTSSTPRSRKFGSFSSCATSKRPTASTPEASSPFSGRP